MTDLISTLSTPLNTVETTFRFWCLYRYLVHELGNTSSRYSMGEGPPIKAGQPEPSLHLEIACGNHHIYEDLNESSLARPGRSQQLEIPLSLNSKRAACFSSPAGFSSSTGFFTRRGDFKARKDSIVRLIFCKCKDFTNPPDF
jgi:hypothetical protein